LFAFFLSGMAALIYQIVWAKELALVFGVTIYAASAVITAFMAGLALGSVGFGRWADRWQRPLVLFALLEVGIGALALLTPLVLSVVLKPIYVSLYGSFLDNHYVMSLVRFVMAFLVLLVPTCLMGGTLPVLSRAYVSAAKRLGGEVAELYSANNFGAFVGCMAAGYVLLELLGLRSTVSLAACLNFSVALVSLILDSRLGLRPPAPGTASEPAAADAASEQTTGLPRPVKVALWVFAIEGFTSLVYQMAWLRMLIFFVNTNIYGVTAIVATYLVGLSACATLSGYWQSSRSELVFQFS
jgi:spermidine synthase